MAGKAIQVNQGDRYNRLTIMYEIEKYISPSGIKARKFKCKCDCGNIIDVILNDLRRNNTLSCGCYKKERISQSNIVNVYIKHGLRYTQENKIWHGIKQRCYNPNNPRFYDYGGRGIGMHPDFRESFIKFYEYLKSSIGLRPGPEYSLDRIDNDGDYTYGNLRWATHSEQQKNKRPRNKKGA